MDEFLLELKAYALKLGITLEGTPYRIEAQAKTPQSDLRVENEEAFANTLNEILD